MGYDELPITMKNQSGETTPVAPGNPSEEPNEFWQFPEYREMIIDFPKTIWIGNRDQVKLALRVKDTENVSRMNSPGPRNLFDNYDVYVETRLDIPGLELSPADPIQEPLIETYDNVFLWEINPKNAGLFTRQSVGIFESVSKRGRPGPANTPDHFSDRNQSYKDFGYDIGSCQEPGGISDCSRDILCILFVG